MGSEDAELRRVIYQDGRDQLWRRGCKQGRWRAEPAHGSAGM